MRIPRIRGRLGRSLDRIDAHMERGNEIMERNTRAFERHEKAFERLIAASDRNSAAFEDFHTFMREMTLRVQKIGEAQMASLERVLARQDDLVAESRAHTRALLAILDRLDPGGSAATA